MDLFNGMHELDTTHNLFEHMSAQINGAIFQHSTVVYEAKQAPVRQIFNYKVVDLYLFLFMGMIKVLLRFQNSLYVWVFSLANLWSQTQNTINDLL